jgi:hypothetical protein
MYQFKSKHFCLENLVKTYKLKARTLPEPQTTKMNKARSHGPTGYFSSVGF